MKTNPKGWWIFSLLVSAALIFTLISIWSEMNKFDVKDSSQLVDADRDKNEVISSQQLVDAEAVDGYLKANWLGTKQAKCAPEPMLKLKTGVFIQSIKFFDSTEVNLTGYIWQRYQDGLHNDIKPCLGEVGFVLPEQVDSGSNIKPQEVYRHRNGDQETIGWYFEATLRQPFEYSQYPFDHKTVWVRMWPKDFSRHIVLVPDFKAYDYKTGKKNIFGLEEFMVLGTWEREDTYFDYKPSSYDTNFGIDNYIGKENFPELHYNFVIKRKFENAFIVHLLPLFLVAALLFAALLTVSGDPDIAGRHGFNTSGLIGACSALFFVVLIAHIQLRQQFAGSGIVYIEYFYFLMYALLVMTAANTYMFCMKSAPWLKIIHYRDNLIPKVLFWPIVLGGMVVLTLVSRNGG